MIAKVDGLKNFIAGICQEKMNIAIPEVIDTEGAVETVFQLDSISMFELIVNLEDKYDTKVPDDDIERIGRMNLHELCAYFEERTVAHG
ncbi:phosphopantetheine-binding protein [Paenibacillus sp. ACRRX]|uniref:acyl carrier protein n=1 Tax=Paenibacillus sp. ACRRX TaxID=2918206 RepID=UPI001EF4245C|nr:phosphopantetheine-binding protein [Paenibacillus sp. ACRRX]MCG7408934.1 phosphopantetheine-binding protein [Paenibacillus sp. ACRRX]